MRSHSGPGYPYSAPSESATNILASCRRGASRLRCQRCTSASASAGVSFETGVARPVSRNAPIEPSSALMADRSFLRSAAGNWPSLSCIRPATSSTYPSPRTPRATAERTAVVSSGRWCGVAANPSSSPNPLALPASRPAFHPILDLAQPLDQALEHRQTDLRMMHGEALEVLRADRQHVDGFDGPDRRR